VTLQKSYPMNCSKSLSTVVTKIKMVRLFEVKEPQFISVFKKYFY
jgi:hypothetical protein